jgi:hypothetical protein
MEDGGGKGGGRHIPVHLGQVRLKEQVQCTRTTAEGALTNTTVIGCFWIWRERSSSHTT